MINGGHWAAVEINENKIIKNMEFFNRLGVFFNRPFKQPNSNTIGVTMAPRKKMSKIHPPSIFLARIY